MKKVLLVIVMLIAVLAAALLIWKVIVPFLGWVLGGIFQSMGAIFGSLAGLLKIVW